MRLKYGCVFDEYKVEHRLWMWKKTLYLYSTGLCVGFLWRWYLPQVRNSSVCRSICSVAPKLLFPVLSNVRCQFGAELLCCVMMFYL